MFFDTLESFAFFRVSQGYYTTDASKIKVLFYRILPADFVDFFAVFFTFFGCFL